MSLFICEYRESNNDHTEEVTIKLLECSIRALKMEMESLKNASFKTFQKRRFFSFLYANDNLTTSVVTQEKWGFTLVREAAIPRTWNARLRWLKVMDLIFFYEGIFYVDNNEKKKTDY